ncbi:zf-HC2 domain-containing protein [Corynebacterium coyleae]|uniref:zf-HC2 domain-containing protein n=1 Tax=Corynebacterium coyleae TaxID=53374 RepID=UPI001CC9539D|nr:zf-HC2 domain-containing protein [Corynebacterium coyleae]UBI08524.1 zf-HC2 domain-containing protein [Corynebacterium coyleae]
MLSHEEVQAALSARIDGEPAGIDDAVVDAHLASCDECQAFLDQALVLSHEFVPQERPAMAPPQDLSEVILASVDDEWRKLSQRRAFGLAIGRTLLFAMAVAWVLWAISLIVAGGEEPVVASSASVRLGVALALAFTAWKPRQIPGVLLIVGSMFTFTVGFAVRDAVLGAGEFEPAAVFIPFVSVIALVWTWFADRGGEVRRAWRILGANPL